MSSGAVILTRATFLGTQSLLRTPLKNVLGGCDLTNSNILRYPYTGRAPRACRLTATESDDQDIRLPGDDDLSSSFLEEVKRRERTSQDGENYPDEDFDVEELLESNKNPRPWFRDDGAPSSVSGNQLKASRDLQNEGLAGFPSIASELLTLGLTVFFSFGPIIAWCSVFFVVTYLLLGSDFIHGGEQDASMPTYITPESLLRDSESGGKLEKL